MTLKTPREFCSIGGRCRTRASARGSRLEDQHVQRALDHVGGGGVVAHPLTLDRQNVDVKSKSLTAELGGNGRARADVHARTGMYFDDCHCDALRRGPHRAGPAGLSCAMALAAAGRRVLILESGGRDAVAGDHSVGYGHFSGGTGAHWVRGLGGTSQAWTGWCTIRRRSTSTTRRSRPCWPVAHAAAAAVLAPGRPDPRSPGRVRGLRDSVPAGSFIGPLPTMPPTRSAEKYGAQLAASTDIDVVVDHPLVGIESKRRAVGADRAHAARRGSDARRRLEVTPAQAVVIAAGGMGKRAAPDAATGGRRPECRQRERPRRPLSDGAPAVHARWRARHRRELDRLWPAATTARHARPGRGAGLAVESRPCRRRPAVLAPERRAPDGALPFRRAGAAALPLRITVRAEMRPVEHNRVVPTVERDVFGLPRLAARCVLDAADYRSVEDTLRLLGETLIGLGRGRRPGQQRSPLYCRSRPGPPLGTTRMGEAASTSVVDGDCRVTATPTCFVAGSSVFPSGGYANPTIHIVALALRLADRLAGRAAST